MIVQQLNQIQEHHGYLPRPALVALAERLAVPLYRIQEVVSFYPHYRTAPPPAVEIHICRDMSCQLRGSWRMIDELQAGLAGPIQQQQVRVCGVSCLGRCDRAPAVRIEGRAADGNSSSGHEVHDFLGRTGDEIQRATMSLLSGGATDPVRTDHDTDLADASSAWKINIYAGRPREERYQALRRMMECIRRSPAAGD